MDETRRGYRGTLWDWTVIPFVAGVFLVGNGIAGGYPVALVIGVVLAVASAGWWLRRRASRSGR
jgi:hypothetical protein